MATRTRLWALFLCPKQKCLHTPQVFDDSSYCYCGLQKADPTDSSCYFCSDNIFSLIHASVKQGKILPCIDMKLVSKLIICTETAATCQWQFLKVFYNGNWHLASFYSPKLMWFTILYIVLPHWNVYYLLIPFRNRCMNWCVANFHICFESFHKENNVYKNGMLLLRHVFTFGSKHLILETAAAMAPLPWS